MFFGDQVIWNGTATADYIMGSMRTPPEKSPANQGPLRPSKGYQRLLKLTGFQESGVPFGADPNDYNEG